MSPTAPKSIDAKQRQRALAGWENEGGAGPCGPLETLRSLGTGHALPKMGKAEMLALHIRVIALENLVIALLASANEARREDARNMASYIAPRAGATPHPITTLASAHMIDLIERAGRFDDAPEVSPAC